MVLRSGLARLVACLVLTTTVAAGCSSDDTTSSSGTSPAATPTTPSPSASTPATDAAPPGSDSSASSASTGAETTVPTPDTTAPAGVAGGTLTYITGTETPGMDPIDGSTSVAVTTNTYFLLLYDQLVRVELDGTIQPRLAQSVTGSADSTTWTITLRDGLTFTDGTPLNSAALIFNWDRFANPDTGGRCVGDAASLASYTAVDDTTVEVVLKAPNSQFPRVLMNCLGTLGSPTAITAAGQDGFTTAPVGAGPFSLKEWVRNDHATFVRNPGFWDAPRPYLDEIVVRPVPDQQQRFDAFRTADGPAAILANVPDEHMSQLAADGYEVKQGKPYGGVSLGFNMSRPPFDDVRVRQAFSYALNLDDINAKAAQGFAEMSKNIFPEGSPFADPSGTTKTNDLAKAQQLIDAYLADGGTINVNFAVAQGIKGYGDVVTQQISRLKGVTINEQILDGAVTTDKLRTRDFDMIWTSGSGIDPDPPLYNDFYTGASNNFGYSNPEMDAALEAGRTSTDLAVRTQAYITVARIWVDDVPIVPVYRSVSQHSVSKDVRGFEVYDLGYMTFSDLWIQQ